MKGNEPMCNDDHPVGRVLNRREVLAFLGASGATMLVSCTIGDSDSDSDDATQSPAGANETTSTPETASGATESEQPEATATAASSDDQADDTATDAAEPTEAAVAETETDELATAIPTCIVSPELTEGPYFVDERLDRFDIRSDPASGVVSEGLPLDLEVRVYQISDEGCLALAGAAVDVWHCDAFGIYSDVSDPGFDTSGQEFLRGYQVTDEAGTVRFTTIYPGWYQGRAVHIHFKIRGDAGDGQSFEFSSQWFCDETVTDEVHSQEPYASKGYRTLLNDGDSIYQQGGDLLLLNLEQAEDGYTGTFDVGLMLS